MMNAAIVAAVSLLDSMAFSRVAGATGRRTASWAPVLIETVQGVVLPARSASFGDVVANTAGMLLGAVLFLPIRPMLRQG
jgi:VanZ family protein